MNWKYIGRDGWPTEDGYYIIAIQLAHGSRIMERNHWRNGGFTNISPSLIYAYLKEPPPLEPSEVK